MGATRDADWPHKFTGLSMQPHISESLDLRLLVSSIRKRGIGNTLAVTLAWLLDFFSDRFNGTDTLAFVEREALDISPDAQAHANMYQPTFGAPLKGLLRLFPHPPELVLVDLGSGKGKVLLVASQLGFKAARGIEVSQSLCAIAQRNCTRWQLRNPSPTVLSVIPSDVRDYDFQPDESIYFLFNPFNAYVLEKVIARMAESIKRYPRRIFVIYRNAVHGDVVERGLCPTRTFDRVHWGLPFKVFEVDPDAIRSEGLA